MTLLLIGFLLRIYSFNDLKFLLERKKFSRLYQKGTGIPKIDTFRDTSKTICVKIQQLTQSRLIKTMRRNKVFESGTIARLMVCALDGSRLFGCYTKHWDSCLTTSIKGKRFYYHSCTVMSSIGDGSKKYLILKCKTPRFVKFVMKYPSGNHSQIMIVTTCVELSLAIQFKMIRARWNIENSIFNNLKNNCFWGEGRCIEKRENKLKS